MNRWSREEFLGSETILHDTVVMEICHDTSFKTHRMCNTKNES